MDHIDTIRQVPGFDKAANISVFKKYIVEGISLSRDFGKPPLFSGTQSTVHIIRHDIAGHVFLQEGKLFGLQFSPFRRNKISKLRIINKKLKVPLQFRAVKFQFFIYFLYCLDNCNLSVV